MDCLIVPKVTLSFDTRFTNLKIIENLGLIVLKQIKLATLELKPAKKVDRNLIYLIAHT